jgi:hypothetical protein
MPRGQLKFPRISTAGPLVAGDCELVISESNGLDEISEAISDEFFNPPPELPDTYKDRVKEVIPSATFIGEGNARSVFKISDKCIVKLSKRYNPTQNKSEIHGWNEELRGEERKYFAPVIDYSSESKWLTMPLIDVNITKEQHRAITKTIVLDLGIDLTDFNPGNFGIVDDNVVCFDYGTGITRIENSPEWSSRQQLWEFLKDTEDF